MIKKAILVVLGLFLLGGLLLGRDLFSYVRTGVRGVQSAARDSVPVGLELNRARDMIRDLDPEIRRSMTTIAKEEAAVEALEREVQKRSAALDQRREQIMRLKEDVAGGGNVFHYAGRSYSSEQVRADLSTRFANYKTCETTLTNLQQVLEARRAGLEAARQKLVEMQAAKQKLELEVENLEARLKMVEVAQAANQVHFDDSHLARTRELIGDLSARIDVMGKLASAETTTGEIPLDEPAAENIVDAVAAYFDEGSNATADSSVTESGEQLVKHRAE
jgi:predicted  nucleic acid-binding Zn-ribbon protein